MEPTHVMSLNEALQFGYRRRDDEQFVYVGRPSKWGNPYSHREGTAAKYEVGTREEAVAAYKAWVQTQPALMAAVQDLQGKTLVCWCKPQACHGDVLAELADAAVGLGGANSPGQV